MPPVTLNHGPGTRRFRALIVVLERRPPAQTTAFGRSAGSSAARATASNIGRCIAPCTWPPSHPNGSRHAATTPPPPPQRARGAPEPTLGPPPPRRRPP